MLDTGIDVPDVVNLVFFKIVRSKTKFYQMLGRGTRLRPDLFGPDQDKDSFTIFDYCGNLDFFEQNPDGVEGGSGEPLIKKLFKHRLELLEGLQPLIAKEAREAAGGDSAQQAKTAPTQKPDSASAADGPGGFVADEITSNTDLATATVDLLHREVAAMNVDNFIVRPRRRHVERFLKREIWDTLTTEKIGDLAHHVAGLPSAIESEHIKTRLFDLICLKLQLTLLERLPAFEHYRRKVQDMAAALEEKDAIPMVKAQMPLIQQVQTDEYWQDITLPMIEQLRRRLRLLVKFIDKTRSDSVYTVLQDQIGESRTVELGNFDVGINLAQYRKKVEQFVRSHADHIAIHKIRTNEPLTPVDLKELERLLFESGDLEGREQLDELLGKRETLPAFIRSLVGLDREAAKKAFSKYLNSEMFSATQIRFVELIIDHLTQNGVMDPGLLYEQPFTGLHFEGLDGVFPGAGADEIIGIVQRVNENVLVLV